MRTLVYFVLFNVFVINLALTEEIPPKETPAKNQESSPEKPAAEEPKAKPQIQFNAFDALPAEQGTGNTNYNKGSTEVISGRTVLLSDKSKKVPRFIFANMDVLFLENRRRVNGRIRINLFHEQASQNVNHFVGLAEGSIEFTDYKTKQRVKRPYYDGLTFHRISKNYLIQGGSQNAKGTSNPGVFVRPELSPRLKHDKPGVVSFVTTSEGNGSQFFITLDEAPDLDKRYTIIGQVVKGQDIVARIGNLPVKRRTGQPKKKVIIKKVTIEKVF